MITSAVLCESWVGTMYRDVLFVRSVRMSNMKVKTRMTVMVMTMKSIRMMTTLTLTIVMMTKDCIL